MLSKSKETKDVLADMLLKVQYDPVTGKLTWKVRVAQRSRVGDFAFNHLTKRGYRTGSFLNKNYLAHRVAWAIYHKNWPDGEIDHINGVMDDNRIDNLRVVNRYRNCQNTKIHSNNSSGYKGVNWHKASRSWVSRITCNGVRYDLGSFSCPQEAYDSYCRASEELHGEYGRKL